MPNSDFHFMAGAGSGAAVMSLMEIAKQNGHVAAGFAPRIQWQSVFGKAILGAIVGGVVGVLPDAIEPAYCPSHCRFFHSKTTGSTLAFLALRLHLAKASVESRQFAAVTIAGYLSHLWHDSQTPAGLPLI